MNILCTFGKVSWPQNDPCSPLPRWLAGQQEPHHQHWSEDQGNDPAHQHLCLHRTQWNYTCWARTTTTSAWTRTRAPEPISTELSVSTQDSGFGTLSWPQLSPASIKQFDPLAKSIGIKEGIRAVPCNSLTTRFLTPPFPYRASKSRASSELKWPKQNDLCSPLPWWPAGQHEPQREHWAEGPVHQYPCPCRAGLSEILWTVSKQWCSHRGYQW